MILIDVNVLIYAFREDTPRHSEFKAWLDERLEAPIPFAVSELVLSGFVRVVTHPRVFITPTPTGEALAFADALRSQPNAVIASPGERHWDIFRGLCDRVGARGNLVPDAYLAALAVESGSEWITTDRDYSRFPGLRWSHPLES